MNIGCIGLGRMGEAIAYRASKGGHQVWAFDENSRAVQEVAKYGARPCTSAHQVTENCNVIWIMVPAGQPVDDVLSELHPYLKEGMIIIDGGNSWYQDSQRRAADLASVGVHFLDCGTSGGLDGRELGYSLMIGGNKEAYNNTVSLFRSIAAADGFSHLGASGAGHYVKMVHNGIEYSMLQAYAEGIHLLHDGAFKSLDLAEVTQVWQHGSIIRSWIGELLHEVTQKNRDLAGISGAIGENLTGAWMQKEAATHQVPTPMLDEALARRAWSRSSGGDYGTKIVALLRNRFGGHKLEEKI